MASVVGVSIVVYGKGGGKVDGLCQCLTQFPTVSDLNTIWMHNTPEADTSTSSYKCANEQAALYSHSNSCISHSVVGPAVSTPIVRAHICCGLSHTAQRLSEWCEWETGPVATYPSVRTTC